MKFNFFVLRCKYFFKLLEALFSYLDHLLFANVCSEEENWLREMKQLQVKLNTHA